VPSELLEEDTIYTFSLSSGDDVFTWAVQTANALEINSVFPGENATRVSLSEPLKIVLSRNVSVDLNDLSDYIHVFPETELTFSQQGRVITAAPEEQWRPGTIYSVEIDAELPLLTSVYTTEEAMSWQFETISDALFAPVLSSSKPYFAIDERPTFLVDGILSDEATLHLYRYSDDEEFVSDLYDAHLSAPSWSEQSKYFDLQKEDAQVIEDYQLTDSVITLNSPLSSGNYLLTLTSGSVTRSALFSVSKLAVLPAAGDSSVLFWVIDTGFDATMTGVKCTDLLNKTSEKTDSSGLVSMPFDDFGIYSFELDWNKLILPVSFEYSSSELGVWSYLFTDKTVYRSDDPLYYFGILSPKDGSPMEYERVSVLLMPKGETNPDRAIHKEFAELTEGHFSGQFILPVLPDGSYSLQIWQSGVLYSESEFEISKEDHVYSASTENSNVCQLKEGECFSQREGYVDTLIIESGSDAIGSSVKEYNSFFTPHNGISNSLFVVDWNGSDFIISEEKILAADKTDQTMSIDIRETIVNDASEIALTVTDADGAPVANAGLFVQILSSEQEPVGGITDMWNDHSNYGISLKSDYHRPFSCRIGETLACEVLRTDESGNAVMSVETYGKCYCIVQSCMQKQGEWQLGSAVVPLSVTNLLPVWNDEPITENSTAYSYTMSTLTGGSKIPAGNQAAIFTDARRGALLDMLLASALSDESDRSVAALLASEHSRQLLRDYNSDVLAPLMSGQSVLAGEYQMSDGGFGNVETSALVSALAPSGISYYALERYFDGILCSGPDPLTEAIALAGSATCGSQVLNEIRGKLLYEELDDEAFLWLLWGQIRSGDTQSAYFNYVDRFTAGHTSVNPAMQAVVAAYIGLADEALLLIREAEGDTSVYNVLIARALLAKSSQETASFTYRSGEALIKAEMSGISDYVLSGVALSSEIQIKQADSNIYCILIRENNF